MPRRGDLVTAARRRALAIVNAEVVNNDQLQRILWRRVHELFSDGADFDRALEKLEADGESAGGARRHVFMLIHQQLSCPLWQLEASCA